MGPVNNLVDVQIKLESLINANQTTSDKLRHLADQVNSKLPATIQKLNREVEFQKKKVEILQDKVHHIEEQMVQRIEFKKLEQSLKAMKNMGHQVEMLRTTSQDHKRQTGNDISHVKHITQRQGKQVDTLFNGHREIRSSVASMQEDVNLLEDTTKKAVGELDTLYDQDHRTQKQLDDLEERVEKIVDVLHRAENDRESKLGLKLEMVEKEVTKLFKFLCLIILAMGIVTFWCLWWQFRVYNRDPRLYMSAKRNLEL